MSIVIFKKNRFCSLGENYLTEKIQPVMDCAVKKKVHLAGLDSGMYFVYLPY
ncbi:hypothetical protein CHISP_0732 [Chitinispirillum alkaliphilum]|nr:hypothetical protein CHISP_0732 [Chitinispirillum alkaliphilum]